MSVPASQVSSQVSQQFSTLIVNAFSLVAALAWSDALNAALARAKVFNGMPMVGPFLYAAGVTLLAYGIGRALAGQVAQPCTRLCASPPTATPAAQQKIQ